MQSICEQPEPLDVLVRRSLSKPAPRGATLKPCHWELEGQQGAVISFSFRRRSIGECDPQILIRCMRCSYQFCTNELSCFVWEGSLQKYQKISEVTHLEREYLLLWPAARCCGLMLFVAHSGVDMATWTGWDWEVLKSMEIVH